MFRRLFKSEKNRSGDQSRNNNTWPDYVRPWENEFSDLAAREDIFFCFRLLLGRNPNREEWQGHSDRAGEKLRDVVQTYVNSQEFADRELMERAIPNQIRRVDYDGFIMVAAEDDIAVGRYVLAKRYEPDVTALFRKFLSPGMCVIDVGANIGYYSMLACSLVGDSGKVIAVEPNSENIKFVEASRRANQFKQLSTIQAAAGEQNGILVLRNEYSNGTCGALPSTESDLFASETVGCIRIDDIVSGRVDLIKVDVEGAEWLAIQGCRRLIETHRPAVVFEFSPPRIVDADGSVAWRDFLAFFLERGYRLSVIRSDGVLEPCETIDQAYYAFEQSGVDHIDLFAAVE